MVLAVVLVRLSYLGGSLRADEAGYLMVARDWHLHGPDLYGSYFVDRPPLLIGLFRLASLVPWDPFVRVLVLPFAALFVVAAGWAGREVGGARGARWAAVVAAALAVSPALSAQEADGEIFAAPLVMVAVACTLTALRPAPAPLPDVRAGGPPLPTSERRQLWWAVAAGLAAGLAVMVKQNFGDGIVFALVLLVASVAQRRLSRRAALRVLAGGTAGGAAVLLAWLLYARASGAGVAGGWFALYGFRSSALDVITDHSLHAPAHRAVTLLLLALVSGIIPLVAVLLRLAWRSRWPGSPVAWAVGVTLAVETVAIAAGGSYWPHYLIQLAPMLALAAGTWGPSARPVRLVAVLTAASALLATAWVDVADPVPVAPNSRATGQWVRDAGRPGDTATVLYGQANMQEATGMRSPYPYLWTLPMRTLDPHLALLRATLSGPQAPTWVVVRTGLDPWGLDPRATTRLVLTTRYHLARTVCGHQVWLRDGLRRELPSAPAC